MSKEVQAGLAVITIAMVLLLFMVTRGKDSLDGTCPLATAGVALIASELKQGKSAYMIVLATVGGVAADQACKYAIKTFVEKPDEPVPVRIQTPSGTFKKKITGSELKRQSPPRPVPAPTAPQPLRVWPTEVVEANQALRRTKILVTHGENLKITATGEVVSNTDMGELPVGPDGHRGRPEFWKFNVLPGENHAALIGRIDSADGDIGTPFFIGQKYEKPMDRSGVLVLGVNDIGLNNNNGEFRVNVVVMP